MRWTKLALTLSVVLAATGGSYGAGAWAQEAAPASLSPAPHPGVGPPPVERPAEALVLPGAPLADVAARVARYPAVSPNHQGEIAVLIFGNDAVRNSAICGVLYRRFGEGLWDQRAAAVYAQARRALFIPITDAPPRPVNSCANLDAATVGQRMNYEQLFTKLDVSGDGPYIIVAKVSGSSWVNEGYVDFGGDTPDSVSGEFEDFIKYFDRGPECWRSDTDIETIGDDGGASGLLVIVNAPIKLFIGLVSQLSGAPQC